MRRNTTGRSGRSVLDFTGTAGSHEDENEKERVDPGVFRFGVFADDDCLTRVGMRQLFHCSDRTLFRMVDRFEIPPPMSLAGRSVWLIGRLKYWLVTVAQEAEANALKEAKRLNLMK